MCGHGNQKATSAPFLPILLLTVFPPGQCFFLCMLFRESLQPQTRLTSSSGKCPDTARVALLGQLYLSATNCWSRTMENKFLDYVSYGNQGVDNTGSFGRGEGRSYSRPLFVASGSSWQCAWGLHSLLLFFDIF